MAGQRQRTDALQGLLGPVNEGALKIGHGVLRLCGPARDGVPRLRQLGLDGGHGGLDRGLADLQRYRERLERRGSRSGGLARALDAWAVTANLREEPVGRRPTPQHPLRQRDPTLHVIDLVGRSPQAAREVP